MAEPYFSGAQKAQVYDLLSRLNASFARVIKNVALLEQAGIFDAQTITRIQTRSEELRADANYRLLGQFQWDRTAGLHTVRASGLAGFRGPQPPRRKRRVFVWVKCHLYQRTKGAKGTP